MAENGLRGRNILIAEDEYLIAMDIKRDLVQAGARVIGPVASLARTMHLIADADHIDVAVLDVNLQGEMVFPAAELLENRGVPFLFTTGYDKSVIPGRFAGVPRCEKPVKSDALTSTIAAIITPS